MQRAVGNGQTAADRLLRTPSVYEDGLVTAREIERPQAVDKRIRKRRVQIALQGRRLRQK